MSQKGQFDCAECGRAYDQHSTIVRHLPTQNVQKRYKCCRCDKSYDRSACLKRHLRIHTVAKPYECERCGQAFSHPSARWLHERTHTVIPTGGKSYRCPWCSRTFARRDRLLTHERKRHPRGEPHKSGQRDKIFVQSEDLNEHERTHTGVKSITSRAFSDPDNHRVHERIQHTVAETSNAVENSE
ncbi:zinc finger protein [Aphelenchoides avenae]|nr:zinc finger protein [Aphelenchus avenae]